MSNKAEILVQRPDSRTLVLDQAAKLFRERGYAGTSLRDIATASGIKSASLYYHFASKDEIVAEVLNIGVSTVHEEVRRRVAALGEHATPADRIREAIAAHLGALLVLDDYTGANIRIFGHVSQQVREATMPPRDRYEDWWRELFADAEARGAFRPGTDVRLVRLLMIGAMNWSMEWHRPRGDAEDSVADIAQSLSDMALHGILAEQELAPTKSGKPQDRSRRARVSVLK